MNDDYSKYLEEGDLALQKKKEDKKKKGTGRPFSKSPLPGTLRREKKPETGDKKPETTSNDDKTTNEGTPPVSPQKKPTIPHIQQQVQQQQQQQQQTLAAVRHFYPKVDEVTKQDGDAEILKILDQILNPEFNINGKKLSAEERTYYVQLKEKLSS